MIVFYNPVSNMQRKPVLPGSLLSLGAVLEGEDFQIVDGNLDDDPVTTIARLVDQGADILAVTVMPGPQLYHAVPHSAELKRRYPHLTIVWGGYFPTQHYESCLRAPYVDFVVRGHGELVFKDLLRRLRAGEDYTNLEGLAFRHPHNGLIKSNVLAPIPHPDQLPDYPYDRIDVERYVRRTFLGTRTIGQHSSYGCPFLCNFCAVVNMVNGRWLARSAPRTAESIANLVESHRINAVEFYDNNFFVHEARTAEFAEQLISRRLDIHWWGEARIDTLLKYSDRTWRLMQKSGLKMVFLGAESGSDETLQRMDKGGTATVEKTLLLAARMRQFEVIPEFSFVLGNPPDPVADARTTMTFVRTLKARNPESEIILYMYTPVPLSGTLFDEAKASGFRFPETLEEWVSPEWQDFSQRKSANMPWLSYSLKNEVRDFQRVLNAYYPTVTDMKLSPWKRRLLGTLSSWRYHTEFYRWPIELQVLQKIFQYQRPDTNGF